ncbi:hypothetical protein EG835_02300, partial [bacterium]|nr:hypothetical protein [bacterium]
MPGAESESAVAFDGVHVTEVAEDPRPSALAGARIMVAWVGLVVVLFGYPALAYLDSSLALVLDMAFFVTVIGLAAIGCAMAWRTAERFERHFWSFFVLINILTLVSQAWFSWYMSAVNAAGPGIPSLADYLNLITLLAFIGLVAG